MAVLLEALEHSQRGGAITKAYVAGRDHAALHRYKRTLDQMQRPLAHSIVYWVWVASAATKAWTDGIAHSDVILKACLLPAIGGNWPLPTQEMHPATPLGLHYAFCLANALQALTFTGDTLRMRAGVVGGMQANLMAALVDATHQVADGGMLRLVMGVEPGIGAATDEVKALRSLPPHWCPTTSRKC